jgi:hypothetical protein
MRVPAVEVVHALGCLVISLPRFRSDRISPERHPVLLQHFAVVEQRQSVFSLLNQHEIRPCTWCETLLSP